MRIRYCRSDVCSSDLFIEKLEDIGGLYRAPPEHALVLCCDEKTQIQALDRTQPGLPLKRGRHQTMTHDYKRNGVTTLFAALNMLTGQVLSMTDQLHRHQERSEEHTSELQSLMRISYAVFCLKKQNPNHQSTKTHHYHQFRQ